MKLLPPVNEVKKFLVIFYIVGIVGFSIPFTRNLFIMLTPFALILNFLLLIYFHKPIAFKSYVIMAVVALLGFAIEALGVETGAIFGSYIYGTTLGFKLLNTPILIGINWLVLTYAASVMLNGIFKNNFLVALLGAIMVTFFDVIMEPVAVYTGMWTWVGGVIPLQNYLMWFVISFVFILLLSWQCKSNKNPIASLIFILQFLFFAALLLAIKIFTT